RARSRSPLNHTTLSPTLLYNPLGIFRLTSVNTSLIIALIKELTEMPYDELLDGFEIVPAVDVPALTLDKFYRLYINRSASRLLDVKSYDIISLACRRNPDEIALVKAGGRFEQRRDAELTTSIFPLDNRHYLHVKVFARLYNVKVGNEPAKYEYNRGASDGSVAVFRRVS